MSLTIQQLLNDAKRLSNRLRDHDASADNIIAASTSVLKEIEGLRQYQEDIDSLNAIAHNRPRAQLVLGIQQENRHIRQLQHENKELRAALEEHQNAIELIMSKYREHMTCLLNSTRVDNNFVNQQKNALLQERADKICEMASVMQQSVQIDEENQAREQELMSRLITENKGLREMLEISHRNGSYSDPLVGPKMVTRGCQTEPSIPSTTTSTTLSSSMPISNDKSSPSAKSSVGFSGGSRALEDSNGSRPLSSLNGNSTPSCENLRPLSSASEESEETSSISDDDEIIFNTIKRQTKKPDSIFVGKNFVAANNNGSAAADDDHDNFNDTINVKNVAGCDAEVAVNVGKTTESLNKNAETNDDRVDGGIGVEGLVKVNGDSHLADCIVEQQQEVLSQS